MWERNTAVVWSMPSLTHWEDARPGWEGPTDTDADTVLSMRVHPFQYYNIMDFLQWTCKKYTQLGSHLKPVSTDYQST